MKHYINSTTHKSTTSATQAMEWHRDGHGVTVLNCYTYQAVHIPGAEQPERNAEEENRATCKHIAKTVEAYANGEFARCPECGEEIHLPHSVGDKYKCPHCGEVVEYNDLEIMGIGDYMSDILDIEYRCGSDREYRSCKIMVTCGGPNIYIDTASTSVKLYWWTDYAEYPISYDARDAIDEWVEEYWNL